MKEGWTYKRLGEVAYYPKERVSSELMNEANYVGVDNLIKDRGGKTLANYVPSEGNTIEYKKGDVLLGNIRPYLKKIWLSDIDGGASGDVLIIRPNNSELLLPNYLYWVLASDHFFEYDTLHCKGAKMPRGNKVDIMNYPVPIPPFEVQKQIVLGLDLLRRTMEKQKAQMEELDKLAHSIFYDMFGDPVTNEKGWEIKKMGEFGTLQRGTGIQKKDFVEMGCPCIHYGQIHTSFGAYTTKHLSHISNDLYSVSRIAHKGDLLMALTSEDVEGSCKSTGWLGDYDVAVSSDAAIFSHNQNVIYLSYYTTTKAFLYEKQKYAKGFKVTHIKTNDIASIPVPLPPLVLQQEFAAKVEAIEQMKAKVRQSLKESEELFNSRMDYYFN